MSSVKYDINQHLTSKNQTIAQNNIGLMSECISYINDMSIFYEEYFWSKQQLDTNTLRLSFENLEYNPEQDNKSPGGIWTKIKTTKANIWDWHREDSDWSIDKSFGYTTTDVVRHTYAPTPPTITYPPVMKYDIVNTAKVITEKYKIIASNTTNVTNLKGAFQNALGLTEIWNQFDFTNCTDCSYMFWCCQNLRTIPGGIWHFPEVLTARDLFLNCENLESDFPYMDFPKNKDLYKAFMFCSKVKKSYGLNSPLCEDMRDLFEGDCLLKEVVTLGETSKVKVWHDIFGGCVSLEKIPSSFDMTSCTSCNGMFSYCTSLKTVPQLNFGTKAGSFDCMFICCSSLTEIPDNPMYHTEKIFSNFLNTNDDYWMYYVPNMPENLMPSSLKKLPDWKPDNITNANYMFYGQRNVSKESVEEWYNFLKNCPTLTTHIGTFRKCAHNENIPDDWK